LNTKNSISVALCTYNGAKYLNQQLDSILNQTVPVTEIVVCDDCSKDNTKDIIESYSKKHPGLFNIHYNTKNLRSNKNFEKAIALASGDYIFLADQDDLWLPNKVDETLKVFNKNKHIEGVFSNAYLIDGENNLLFEDFTLWDNFNFPEHKLNDPKILFKRLIYRGNFLTGATLCISKKAKDSIFPFQTVEKKLLHDEWIAHQLARKNTLFFSKECLVSYRIHENQQVGIGDDNIIKLRRPEISPIMKVILGINPAKKFKDYKDVARASFMMYEKYKEITLSYKTPLTEEVTEHLKQDFIYADTKMKKINPIKYYFRKRHDKRKGKRQL